MSIKNSKGFTLVEMLVVIAIISVLAAALFPAISSALSTAAATALKTKGRGIWTAIVSANTEREQHNEGAVWPKDLVDDEDISFTESAVGYFNFLLSDGETTGTTTADENKRIVADLKPETLIANGVSAAKLGDALTEKNIAWGVVVIPDSAPAEVAFLISRNYDSTAKLKQMDKKENTSLELNKDIKPFNATRAVWVARGGGVFDARPKYFTMSSLMGIGDTSTEYDYWAK